MKHELSIWPGGLRAQILVGIGALLVGSFALLGMLIESVLASQIERGARERGLAAARLVGHAPETPLDELARDFRLNYVSFQSGEAERVWGKMVDDGVGFVALTRENWRVEIDLNYEEETHEIRRWRGLVWGFLAAEACLLLLFVYGFLTFLVVRPVRAMGVATERAGAGDLASAITVLPPNEFGKVAHSFNQMLERLEASKVQLEEQMDALIRSEKLASVGQLAAGVAHEVGNPLAAISGYVDVIDDEMSPEDLEDVLARMRKQLLRIQHTIRALLDFSREDGVEPILMDPKECVDEALELVKTMSRSRNVVFEVDLPDALPRIRIAPAHLVQVLLNLLMNAVDAMGEQGGRVYLGWMDGVLEIRDSGPGIPEDLRHRIFDPFFTTKEPGKGTGLGLAISAKLMGSMGGSLILGPSDEGARFLVKLPEHAP